MEIRDALSKMFLRFVVSPKRVFKNIENRDFGGEIEYGYSQWSIH